MHLGTTRILRSALRTVALIGMVCAIACAQNTSPAQSSPSTPPRAAWDPDYGPPRTAGPPPRSHLASSQRMGRIRNHRLRQKRVRTIRAGLFSRSKCKKWFCTRRSPTRKGIW